ncbi:MAG TPA: hypothetical protein VN031_03560 [Candidatus Microsaccharimonas sp.]|nr:hypothetical protein [Candidatus Microsaccharimonas sp.]
MEKAMLYSKITLCLALISGSLVAIFAAWVIGDVNWFAVGVRLIAWVGSILLLTIVLLELRDILGFVRRTVQHQLNGPKGNFLLWILLVVLALLAITAAICMYGKYYVSLIQYGSELDGIVALAFAVSFVSVCKTYGYHRFGSKRLKTKTDSHEYVPVSELFV